MAISRRYKLLAEAITCTFALMVFSFFIHYKFPLKLISLGALLFTAWIFTGNLRSFSDLKYMIGKSGSPGINIFFISAGILTGILFGVFYRWHLEVSLFPLSVHLFVLVAALIGSVEELVFRGILQDYVSKINAPFSVLFSTFSHTAYKCCLFLSPMVTSEINIGFLIFWTFFAGILLGAIRHVSRSILPSMIAHALFDIIVYAEFVNAPWWVW